MSGDMSIVGAAVTVQPTAPTIQPVKAVEVSTQSSATTAWPAGSSARAELRAPKPADLGFDPQAMRQNLAAAIDRLNEQMRSNGRDLNFRIDERIERTVITVKQAQTGEVVRQIPAEEILKLAHSIEDIKGLLFNEVI